jgi:hypothetical protein
MANHKINVLPNMPVDVGVEENSIIEENNYVHSTFNNYRGEREKQG